MFDFLTVPQKLKRWLNTVTEVLALKTHLNTPDLEAWKCFKRTLELLDIDGMLDEKETIRNLDNQVVTMYLVMTCPWRADEITQYLKLIDQTAQNPALQNSRGSRLAPRFPSRTPGATFKKGLPRVMYNAEWLLNQKAGWPDFEKDVLDVSDESYEFLVVTTHS